MKITFILQLVLFLASCNGQNNSNTPIPDKTVLPSKNNIQVMDSFNIKNYITNQNEDGYYIYKNKDGDSIIEIGSTANGFTRTIIEKNNPAYEIYKEYYGNGHLKLSGTQILNGVMIGNWRFYDEKGQLTSELNEDNKFGKFGPLQVLKFLENERLINLKTGEGFQYLNISFGTQKIPDIHEARKNNVGLPDKGEWSISFCKSVPACDHIYIIDGEDGKVISHKNIKGEEMIK